MSNDRAVSVAHRLTETADEIARLAVFGHATTCNSVPHSKGRDDELDQRCNLCRAVGAYQLRKKELAAAESSELLAEFNAAFVEGETVAFSCSLGAAETLLGLHRDHRKIFIRRPYLPVEPNVAGEQSPTTGVPVFVDEKWHGKAFVALDEPSLSQWQGERRPFAFIHLRDDG